MTITSRPTRWSITATSQNAPSACKFFAPPRKLEPRGTPWGKGWSNRGGQTKNGQDGGDPGGVDWECEQEILSIFGPSLREPTRPDHWRTYLFLLTDFRLNLTNLDLRKNS